MGVASPAEYKAAIEKLFPKGEYWERQFADPESDVSLFCRAKLPELINFRQRMESLQNESFLEKTEELVSEWERVLLKSSFPNLSLLQRRLQLSSRWSISLNREELQKIATKHGLAIADVYFPYRPGFFGFSRFGHSYIGSPAVFSVLFFDALQKDFKENPWELINPYFSAKKFGRMRFGIDRLIYFPMPSGSFSQGEHFFCFLKKALINRIIRDKQIFKDFEQAIANILLANQIPYFFYKEGFI